jgi:DNA-binding transcriptional ArsR family regulator
MEKQPFCDCDVIHEEVVNEVREKMFSKESYNDLAMLYKMFADSTRVQILHALELNEMCVCDLAVLLGVTKSAVSHQLKSLRLSNLVKFRKEGQVVFYSLSDSHVRDILDKGFEHTGE